MSRHFDDADGLSQAHDPATHGFVFNQTMMRIKSPQASLEFYTGVMGMTLVKKLDFPEMKFSLFFLAALGPDELDEWSDDDDQRLVQTFSRPAMLELTYNWGDEDDDTVSYHNGNTEPKGFGHIGFCVPDIDAACKRFEDRGVKFIKRPDAGNMKDIAFITDPDGYWIEIFSPERLSEALNPHF